MHSALYLICEIPASLPWAALMHGRQRSTAAVVQSRQSTEMDKMTVFLYVSPLTSLGLCFLILQSL